MGKFMTPVRYGLIAALVGCILAFITYLFYHQIYSSLTVQMFYGFISLAVWVFIPIWSGVTFKREQVGHLSFGDAFLAVFITFLLSNVGSSLTNYLIPNVIDKNYPGQLLQQVRTSTEESMEKFGTSQDQIDKAMDKINIDSFRPTIVKTLKYFGIGLLISAVLSLIIAGFIRRNPPTVPAPDTPTPTI